MRILIKIIRTRFLIHLSFIDSYNSISVVGMYKSDIIEYYSRLGDFDEQIPVT